MMMITMVIMVSMMMISKECSPPLEHHRRHKRSSRTQNDDISAGSLVWGQRWMKCFILRFSYGMYCLVRNVIIDFQ